VAAGGTTWPRRWPTSRRFGPAGACARGPWWHSWGADLGLAYALTYPEAVSRLVHVCGTGLQNDRDWSAAYHAGEASRPSEPLPGAYGAELHAALTASWREWIKRPGLWRDVASC
jgi:proline iminopeptidase